MTRRRLAIAAGVASAWMAAACAGGPSGAAQAAAESPSAPATRLAERTWENYFGATILPSGRALVVGDKGVLLVSEDQGRTWSRRQLRKGAELYDLYSVAFTADGQRGWVVGDGGVIFRSDDGGLTWAAQENSVREALLKVAVVDAQTACAVGDEGTVLCTSNGGASWRLQKFENFVFFDIAFADPHNGWAVGEYATALHTVDGGKTWALVLGGQRNLSADPYFAIAFTDPVNGVALGLNGGQMVTTDGGKSWQPGTLAGDTRSIYSAVAKPADGLYVGGADGTLGTDEHGRMLAAANVTSNTITAVALASNYGLAVGLAGTVLRSEDGGQRWNSVTANESARTRAQ